MKTRSATAQLAYLIRLWVFVRNLQRAQSGGQLSHRGRIGSGGSAFGLRLVSLRWSSNCHSDTELYRARQDIGGFFYGFFGAVACLHRCGFIKSTNAVPFPGCPTFIICAEPEPIICPFDLRYIESSQSLELDFTPLGHSHAARRSMIALPIPFVPTIRAP
jgi:hypothetical protein